MKTQNLFAIVAVSLACFGCIGTPVVKPTRLDHLTLMGTPVVEPTPSDYSAIKSGMKTSIDEHEGSISVTAPSIKIPAQKWPSRGGNYYLINVRNVKEDVSDDSSVTIIVGAYFYKWAFLEQAHSKGEKLDFVKGFKNVVYCNRGSCNLSEAVGILLTLGEIKKNILPNKSFVFKISGIGGSIVVDIPKAYFKAFVDTLENK